MPPDPKKQDVRFSCTNSVSASVRQCQLHHEDGHRFFWSVREAVLMEAEDGCVIIIYSLLKTILGQKSFKAILGLLREI